MANIYNPRQMETPVAALAAGRVRIYAGCMCRHLERMNAFSLPIRVRMEGATYIRAVLHQGSVTPGTGQLYMVTRVFHRRLSWKRICLSL